MKVSCLSSLSLSLSLFFSFPVSASVFFAPLSGKFGALQRDLRAFKMIRKLSYDLHDSTLPKQWQLIKNNFRNLSIVLSPSSSCPCSGSSVGDNRKVCMKSISTWATMGHFCAPNRSHLSGFLLTCPMRAGCQLCPKQSETCVQQSNWRQLQGEFHEASLVLQQPLNAYATLVATMHVSYPPPSLLLPFSCRTNGNQSIDNLLFASVAVAVAVTPRQSWPFVICSANNTVITSHSFGHLIGNAATVTQRKKRAYATLHFSLLPFAFWQSKNIKKYI